MDLQEVLEALNGLTRAELRSVIWEALLISDGPDKIDGECNSMIRVEQMDTPVQGAVGGFIVTSPCW